MDGGEDHDVLFLCQTQDMFVRAFSPDKDDTDDIQHFRGAHHLWIAQTCDQDGLLLRIGQDIAHHIRGKYKLSVQIQQFLSEEYLGPQ